VREFIKELLRNFIGTTPTPGYKNLKTWGDYDISRINLMEKTTTRSRFLKWE